MEKYTTRQKKNSKINHTKKMRGGTMDLMGIYQTIDKKNEKLIKYDTCSYGGIYEESEKLVFQASRVIVENTEDIQNGFFFFYNFFDRDRGTFSSSTVIIRFIEKITSKMKPPTTVSFSRKYPPIDIFDKKINSGVFIVYKGEKIIRKKIEQGEDDMSLFLFPFENINYIINKFDFSSDSIEEKKTEFYIKKNKNVFVNNVDYFHANFDPPLTFSLLNNLVNNSSTDKLIFVQRFVNRTRALQRQQQPDKPISDEEEESGDEEEVAGDEEEEESGDEEEEESGDEEEESNDGKQSGDDEDDLENAEPEREDFEFMTKISKEVIQAIERYEYKDLEKKLEIPDDIFNFHDDEGKTALITAIEINYLEGVEELLKYKGIDINVKEVTGFSKGYSPLDYAIYCAYFYISSDIVSLLTTRLDLVVDDSAFEENERQKGIYKDDTTRSNLFNKINTILVNAKEERTTK